MVDIRVTESSNNKAKSSKQRPWLRRMFITFNYLVIVLVAIVYRGQFKNFYDSYTETAMVNRDVKTWLNLTKVAGLDKFASKSLNDPKKALPPEIGAPANVPIKKERLAAVVDQEPLVRLPSLSKQLPSTEETRKNTDTTEQQQPLREPKKKRLNVIVLYPDDMRHDSLSIAGTQAVQTPFLDFLSQTGIRFRKNCVTTSICWISRATMFTGQYHLRHQARYLSSPVKPDAWNHSYPHILKENGYYLGHIGKWQYYNFDFVQKFYHFTRLYEGSHIYRGEHVTDKDLKHTLEFLRTRPKDRNFLVTVAFYAPKAVGQGEMQWTPKKSTEHLYLNITFQRPHQHNESFYRLPNFHHHRHAEARKRWAQRFGTAERYHNSMRNYYRMITELDETCKKIYEEVKEQGILNETMIIFTTDNGFFHGEHGLAGKWFPYQESIRVPLIIHDPRIPPEKVGIPIDEFTLNIDLAETILGAAGLPPDPRMQGRDIADLYLKPKNATADWRQEFFYEFPGMGPHYIPEANALVRHDFKYFVYPLWKVEQLFNIQEDPLEEHDLSREPKYQNLLKEMRKRYQELQQAAK